MAFSFLTQEDGFKITLEDGSGFLILESSSSTQFDFPLSKVRLERRTARINVIRSIRSITLFRATNRMNVLRKSISQKLARRSSTTKF